jgi:hypothetical protein
MVFNKKISNLIWGHNGIRGIFEHLIPFLLILGVELYTNPT